MMRNWYATRRRGGMALALFGGLLAFLAPRAALLSDDEARLGSGAYWNKKEEVKRRPPKIKRVHTPPFVRQQSLPLLTLEWQMLRCAGSQWVEADPQAGLRQGEPWRLKLWPNQDGYLYVFSLTEKSDCLPPDPQLIFPDSRIANGQNLFKKNATENAPAIFPSRCSEGKTDGDDPCACAFEFTTSGANEVLVLLFSRDLLTDLPDYLCGGNAINPELIGILKERYRRQTEALTLKRYRPTKARPGAKGVGPHTFRVSNFDTEDNEELVEIIRVPTRAAGNDQEPPAAAQGVQERDIDLEYKDGKVDGMRLALFQEACGQFKPVPLDQVFRSCDKFRVEFEANFDGYVYVLNITPEGRACLLFPNAAERDSRVPARLPKLLPEQSSLILNGAKGLETLQFYLSRAPIKLFDDALAEAIGRGEKKACLGKAAESAVRELAEKASKSQKSEIVAGEGESVIGGAAGQGQRSRKARLYLGKDKPRKETTVAVEPRPQQGGKLGKGEYIFFDLRLVHQ